MSEDGAPQDGQGRFAAARRSALLEQLRAARARRPAAEQAERPAPARRAARRSFDFSTLPAHKQMRMQRAAAEMMGIEPPFFRVQEGYAAQTCVIEGRELLNFSSYNYLGLNGHPHVRAAAKAAIDRYGVSVSASRVVAGERDLHRRLEQALARFLGVEDAAAFVSGHATNVTAIGTLLGPRDLALVDALAHNSIYEGARLSGATRITFPHNDFAWVDDFLTRRRGDFERVLIAVEGLYSMDGDAPDLPAFVEVKSRHDAWLMVDEAHALGVLGATGRGIAEAQGVDPASVEIWMGTLSKTLSSCGGYIAGSAALVDLLKATAPGFVYSVGLAAPLTAAALAALEVLEAEPERVARLQRNGARLLERARAAGLDTGLSQGFAVTPVIVGDSARAAILSDMVRRRGVNALPITFPAVPEKQARLRFFVSADHAPEQIDRAVEITAAALPEALARPLIAG
ncbi:aminotransferase class I/II-fold pyridoxal phosphate-dependent enzyme [Oceanicella actignis]|uniref:8-amino-7-oxononanoate synthase n=1 Tax=Oceanicella actignis TaxID=1189325 RepID=A0A1M7T5W5_9RHOB|nr:aminotransferase class I/II-fold pyridoxal phosphate-dependent enzyme [Oceanicella actignis]TYO84853.1 8-amino-7-oxononanoate synthase [Oceanicella actignis]SET43796.1 Aminotransferase class I and II [Oceanicella actignis]SHN66087.1 8-amino-7-oxononanoate synthase [Oceanicella actignis]